MLADYLLLGALGFVAQLIDGALGMAFGVISTSVLLTMGVPVAQASAVVHTAEIFTTAASATSHVYHRNVDWRLVARLGVGGVLGAVIGAWVLSNVDSQAIRPYVSAYLLALGIFILFKAARKIPRRDAPFRLAPPLGVIGGFLDASGGGGWGPIVSSTLIGSGQAPRRAVGSVNTTEFFVTVAAASTFFIELGIAPWQNLIALIVGGVIAAPLGGWAVRHLPARVLMVLVGLLVVTLALWQLARTFKLV
ncbi:MAG: sulfite exporter TauE/SafE family protein [Xanthobacteraceae bacterium]